MIKYIKRQDLDIVKYDNCIKKSIQSRVYAFSWYLDIVADNWDVLVLGDYNAVMPISWRKKYGFKYVYPPFWLLELGIFSLSKNVDANNFVKLLFSKFKSVELRLNTQNTFEIIDSYFIEKKMQFISLKKDYDTVFSLYRKDRRKDLQKAKKADLIEKWNDKPEKLIQLFKDNVGKRTPNIVEKDYKVLEKIIKLSIKNRVGELLSIYNKADELVAAGFFLKHNDTITILVSSTNFKNRKNGANTFLIDRAIYRFHKNYDFFNFGGSSMKTIANYFLSFGASNEVYQQVMFRNLPWFLKLFKK
ncbi:hypothetical protein [Polaribacter ponticola]|uniref:GNAT family N-acetyltransferase n=1 Tax=Polaribacter ponticola TaxID=2978475 RepID=A0ABT5S9G3_9FLAO|nr:hypothetical protein [Polaribacter sp. MSW5]MDD7914759.1 hypothetical protein [Polaribacter sp. MSW5]